MCLELTTSPSNQILEIINLSIIIFFTTIVLSLFYHSQSASLDTQSILNQYCFFFKKKLKNLSIINLYLAIIRQKHNNHKVTKNPIKK